MGKCNEGGLEEVLSTNFLQTLQHTAYKLVNACLRVNICFLLVLYVFYTMGSCLHFKPMPPLILPAKVCAHVTKYSKVLHVKK